MNLGEIWAFLKEEILKLGKTYLGIVILGYALLISGLMIVSWWVGDFAGAKLNHYLLPLVMIQVALSIKVLRQEEIGFLLLLGGRMIKGGLEPGIVFAPFPIIWLWTTGRQIEQMEIPDVPEKIWRGDADTVPEDLTPPLRITHALKDTFIEGIDEESEKEWYQGNKDKNIEDSNIGDPFKRRIIAEISIYVRWRVDPNKARDFLQNMGGDMEEVRKQIKATAIGVVQRYLPRMTVAKALVKLEAINDKLTESLKEILEGGGRNSLSWGLKLEDSRIMHIGFNRTLNAAVVAVPTSEFKAEAERIEGKARADIRLMILRANAEGYKEIADKLGIKEGQVILAMEMLKGALESSHHTIIAGAEGFNNLMGIAQVLKVPLPPTIQKG